MCLLLFSPTLVPGEELEMKTYSCNVTGREIVQLTERETFNTMFYPTNCTWSHDGESIFFESWPSGGWRSEEDILLMEANAETGELKELTNIGVEETEQYGDAHLRVSSAYHSDYSPVTDRIVFYDRTGHNLYNYDRKTGKVIELWHEKEGTIGDPPDYSTDGSRIVFYVLFPGPKENRVFCGKTSCIFILDIDVETGEAIGEPKVVTCYAGRKGSPQSPRETIINHCQFNPQNKDEISYAHEFLGAPYDGTVTKERIWFVRADGRDERPAARENPGRGVTHELFGPKGEHIYFADTGSIARVNVSTREVEVILPCERGLPVRHIGVSPDEKWVVADTLISNEKSEDGLILGSLLLINVETGEHQLLCVFPIVRRHPAHPHPNFSPDGTKIAFAIATESGCNLAYIDVSDIVGQSE